MDEAPLRLTPGKTDAQNAADLRARLLEELLPICAILDEAATHGLSVTFNVGTNNIGRHIVTALTIAKQFP